MFPHDAAKPTLALPLDELRRATRFRKEPDTEFATVRLYAGAEFVAEVHDESLGGLGLIVADASGFQVASPAIIVYHSERLSAVVRHVSSLNDGTFLVGFECHAS